MTTILSISDVHFHQYNNGITLADVVDVCSQFVDLCKIIQPDIVAVCGDYTLSHNPTYEVMMAINRFFVELNKLGIPVEVLMGNHDRVYKSEHKLHILEHLKLFNSLDNIEILDTVGFTQVHTKNEIIDIYAVPAGHKLDQQRVKNNNSLHREICLAHTSFIGSKYQNGIKVESGEQTNEYDHGFSVILVGDNHMHQEIPGFKTTRAVSIGAPMQHNWGDAGSVRGFVKITISGLVVDIEQIPSNHPKFIKMECKLESENGFADFVKANIADWKNNLIKLTLSGKNDVLNSIDIEQWRNMIQSNGVRSIDIKPNFTSNDSVSTVVHATTDAEDWGNYLSKRQAELSDIDIDKLKRLGLDFIND